MGILRSKTHVSWLPTLAVVPLMLAAGGAWGQAPAPTTDPATDSGQDASWVGAMVELRQQLQGRSGLFVPQGGGLPFQRGRFGPQRGGFAPQRGGFGQSPGGSGSQRGAFGPPGGAPGTSAPAHPLATAWAKLEQDYPRQCDWFCQDLAACGFVCSPSRVDSYPLRWFGPRAEGNIEQRLVEHVLQELGDQAQAKDFRQRLDRLADAEPHTRPWLELYTEACQVRRGRRLASLAAHSTRFLFTKHYNMGGSHYAFTEGLSDALSERHFQPGSALCQLEIVDGQGVVKTLIEDPHGVIRDPDVSYDGQRVLFAWKKSNWLDDYHLHELDLTSMDVRQLTFGLGYADYEGIYLPNGDIVFNSSRCVQSVDCFFTEVSNFYTCDRDGRFLRRLGFDQVHTNYPTLGEDGRVLYTRWEYNDRGQLYTQGLFQMNPDGTSQTECYGNNSYFPTAILHARQIPGSQKVLAIASGHHCPQQGKLIMLDRVRGLQESEGAQLVAPVRRTPAVTVDRYGQNGALWQYPYPLSEDEYVVAFSPWGSERDPLLFGIYLMCKDGSRELLVQDRHVSCNQPVAVQRPPAHQRPSTTDYANSTGTFYIQDVYAGPGLAGIERGTAKRLRVVSLDFRPLAVGGNHNRGEAGMAYVSTPVSIAQGSWQAKTVEGETPIHPDGSVYFTAPARKPLYFQVIDQQGQMIQTMRSWTTLQPGENASCVGCHEQKSDSPLAISDYQALRQGPAELEPFYGPPRGFSFSREIQPILDQHCTDCHNDRSNLVWRDDSAMQNRFALRGNGSSGNKKAFSMLATTTVDMAARRRFTDGYLSLTGAQWGYDDALEGTSRELVNWISPQSGPPMCAPYSAGSAKSELLEMLRAGHEGTKLSVEELDKLACWIDLVVPFCGDYTEANAWLPFEQARFQRVVEKRTKMEEMEQRNIRQLIADQHGEVLPTEPGFRVPLRITVSSGDGQTLLENAVKATPDRAVVVELPRALQPGDQVSVEGTRHLAVHFPQATHESLAYAPQRKFCWTVSEARSGSSNPTTTGASEAVSTENWFTVRPAALRDLDAYRDLASAPVGDAQGNVYPRSETAPDVVAQVDVGRTVRIDKVVVTLQPDNAVPAKGTGVAGTHQAELVFSDGHRETIQLWPTDQPQAFALDLRAVSSVQLVARDSQDPLLRAATVQLQLWGRDGISIGRDLEYPAF